MCYTRSFVLFWRIKYFTPPCRSLIIATKRLYKISWLYQFSHINRYRLYLIMIQTTYLSDSPSLLHCLHRLSDLRSENSSQQFCPWVILSSQFPVIISKGGLTFLPPLKPFLLRKWHVWLLELTTFVAEDGINFFLYTPHDMLSPSSQFIILYDILLKFLIIHNDPNGIWTRCYHRERVVS